MLYNVVLVSAVQRSDSSSHIVSFIVFSVMIYHRILNIAPCAIEYDFVVYPFYVS